MYTKKMIKKKMGRKAFIDSELFFSDTVHQFLRVLTLSLKELSSQHALKCGNLVVFFP